MIGCLYSRYKESSYSKYHRDTSTEGEGGGHTPHSALLTMMHSAHTGGLVGGYLVSETVRARKPSHKGPRICDGKAHKTRRSSMLCVRATCGARALWGPRSGRDGAGRGISAAQTPPAGAAGGPRAGVVAVATSARGGCRRGGAATTCRAARGGAALRGRGGGQGRRQTREARSALTGRPPCPPEQPLQHV